MLMNLFVHYAFDAWMQRNSPNCPFARYADDAVVHCRSQRQAEHVMRSIASRLAVCGLTMHPEKSKIVYCKDSNRRAEYPHVSFTFLGFTFRPRKAIGQQNKLFTSFLPGVSAQALKRMRRAVREWRVNRQTHVTLAAVARLYNPVIQGWCSTMARSIGRPCLASFDISIARSSVGPVVSTKYVTGASGVYLNGWTRCIRLPLDCFITGK
ncbi:reverse transcriptase [compost metagenome]